MILDEDQDLRLVDGWKPERFAAASCNTDLGILHSIKTKLNKERGRAMEKEQIENGMPLKKGIFIYLAVLSVFSVVASLCIKFSIIFDIWILIYFVAGIFLNRVVFRSLVDMHPIYSTLANVSNSKLKQMLFWPLSYPLLFFRLTTAKYL